jgi:ATP-dependent RNA helicase DDX19/DBP5
MQAEGHQVASLHGQKEAGERDAIIDGFRDGKTKVLITTNVIARGIDIQQVNMVVNYDMPLTHDGKPDSETYLHRVGRTGRFGRKGVAIAFVHDKRSWDEMHAIEEDLQREIIRVDTSDFDEMEAVRGFPPQPKPPPNVKPD